MTAPAVDEASQLVQENPLVVWVTLAGLLLWLASSAVARAVPPITESLQRIREHRQRSEDARIRDLSQQVDHLTGRVWTLEQLRQREQAQLLEHAQWDHAITMAAVAAGVDVPPMPPLRPALAGLDRED